MDNLCSISYQNLYNDVAHYLRQPPEIYTDQWAETYSFLPQEDASEPGKYTSERAPWQAEPMRCTDTHRFTVLMWASGMGKTTVMKNKQGKRIHINPGSALCVQPTESAARTYSLEKFESFCRDTKVLNELIPPRKTRSSDNSILYKKYPGGQISFIGANSSTDLALRHVRDLDLDEIDRYRYEVGEDGETIGQAIQRTVNFYDASILLTSTPTYDGKSRIQSWYKKSDQRKFHVPCPECEFKQPLIWKNLKWDTDSSEPYYVCANCGSIIEEHKKDDMVMNGEWVKENPESDIAGFHINSLYSLWVTWSQLRDEFLDAKKDIIKLKGFIMRKLGEPFQERGDAPDHLLIYAKREFWDIGKIPNEDILLLTCSVDRQPDRFECEVKGWTQNQEPYSIERHVFMCDTAKLESYNKNLNPLLDKIWDHPGGGVLKIRGMAIDTGGWDTQVAYMWVRSQDISRVYAIKGVSSPMAINKPTKVDINFEGKAISNGVTLWGIGVSVLKSELYARLRMNKNEDGTYPFGYYHFPDYPEHIFQQLVSETMVVKIVNSIKKYYWEKIYAHNEFLDLNVYNRAMALILGIDNMTKNDWEQLKEYVKNSKFQNNSPKIMKNVKRRGTISKGIQID